MTTDTRTPEERTYDWHMTEARGQIEADLFERGYWLGILSDYLDESFIDEVTFYAQQSSWFHAESFANARAEGAAEQYERTAEDLFVWAHDWMAGYTSPGNPA